MTDIVERLRAMQEVGVPTRLELDAADEIERLHALCDNLSRIAISKEAEIERLRDSNAEMLAVLNAARIMLKNRDQRPNEMKLLDAIKIVIANAEGRP